MARNFSRAKLLSFKELKYPIYYFRFSDLTWLIILSVYLIDYVIIFYSIDYFIILFTWLIIL
jgi:hypothetical protein